MNNIDILEEKIKIIESLCTDDCINKGTVIEPLKYAISNLISENKELKKEKDRVGKLYYEANENCIKYERDYISKSKVEAKIEEVSNGTFDAKIVMQSLLEKE